MIREVIAAGRTARIEIDGGRFRYETLEGEFVVTPAGHGTFSVLLKGRSYRVVLGSRGKVLVNGRELEIEVFDPRDLRADAGARANHGRQEIAAPMPGKIVRVLVSAGDTVEEGQGVVVVEAMKMQNEMKSPKTGRVAEVRTSAGSTAAAGDVLVVIE
ncbi:MAG: acetyl-CoA carboxylase biotin carboxyl carrier protein subunit [Bryobacteraceae bacterium]